MKQQYFILVLAHSLHGRLRRIHVHHHVIYAVLILAVLGAFSVFGFLSSYLRMAWKVANYNALRTEVESLRKRYQNLQQMMNQTNEQLATLQIYASEVSVAYGLKRKLEGPIDISSEGRLVPTFNETIAEYNFLKSANFSTFSASSTRREFAKPNLWPVQGRLLSFWGRRTDPFTGEGARHTGIDISAPTGTPVKASADGVVKLAQYMAGYGKLVVIDHGRGLATYYAHLSRFDVVAGQEVRQGEILGRSGATGRATSPHLHWEVRQNGTPMNPYPFLAKPVVAEAKPQDFAF